MLLSIYIRFACECNLLKAIHLRRCEEVQVPTTIQVYVFFASLTVPFLGLHILHTTPSHYKYAQFLRSRSQETRESLVSLYQQACS